MTDPQSVTFVRAAKPGSDDTFKTAQDRCRVQSGSVAAQTFARFRVQVPQRRELVSATLRARAEDTIAGTLTARSVEPDSGPYRKMTWNSRPGVVSGSADRTPNVWGGNNASAAWDVTADVATALAADRGRVAFRISSSSTQGQWLRTKFFELELTTRPQAVEPSDLAPVGEVGALKPTFTWQGPSWLTKIQLQIATDAAFTNVVYDSGQVTSTVPRVDTATGPAWAGLSGTMHVRARHLVSAGWTPWTTGSVTYTVPPNFVVSNPGASDADPSPPSVWTPAADAVEIVSFLDGRRLGSTGLVPGPLTSATPKAAQSAKRAGQVLRRVHRFPSGLAYPAFVERVTTTTFTPTATVAGLTGFTAAQVPGLPAVLLTWSRSTGVPDEVGVYRDGVLAATVDGPAGRYLDWACPPNTNVSYGATAVVNGKHSTTQRTQLVRTVVKGWWLVDATAAETDATAARGCVLAGLETEIGYGGEVVVHTPIDGAILLRRTLTLRGPEGTIAGRIDDAWPGRTTEDQKDDVMSMREAPERVLRLIGGDLSTPVVCTGLEAIFDREASFADRIVWNVSGEFSHAGGD